MPAVGIVARREVYEHRHGAALLLLVDLIVVQVVKPGIRHARVLPREHHRLLALVRSHADERGDPCLELRNQRSSEAGWAERRSDGACLDRLERSLPTRTPPKACRRVGSQRLRLGLGEETVGEEEPRGIRAASAQRRQWLERNGWWRRCGHRLRVQVRRHAVEGSAVECSLERAKRSTVISVIDEPSAGGVETTDGRAVGRLMSARVVEVRAAAVHLERCSVHRRVAREREVLQHSHTRTCKSSVNPPFSASVNKAYYCSHKHRAVEIHSLGRAA